MRVASVARSVVAGYGRCINRKKKESAFLIRSNETYIIEFKKACLSGSRNIILDQLNSQ